MISHIHQKGAKGIQLIQETEYNAVIWDTSSGFSTLYYLIFAPTTWIIKRLWDEYVIHGE